MHPILRVGVALLVGALVFGVVAVAVTAGFQPQIELSLLIGLPVGMYAGVTAMAATYVELTYRDRENRGTRTAVIRRARRAAGVTVAAFVVVVALGVAIYAIADDPLGIEILLAGLPIALLASAIGGYLWAGSVDEQSSPA